MERYPSPEELASKFHELYEKLAPSHGYETREDTSVPFDNLPEPNKSLMLDVAGEIITWMEEKYPRREQYIYDFFFSGELLDVFTHFFIEPSQDMLADAAYLRDNLWDEYVGRLPEAERGTYRYIRYPWLYTRDLGGIIR